jgi:nuclear cap-binding protein subunit 2
MDLFWVQDKPQEITFDKHYFTTEEECLEAMKKSRTVYVGNLNDKTTETQINEVFSAIGAVKAVVMGVNNKTKIPCGFCFVEYFIAEHAAAALKFLDGSVVDTNVVRIDMDTGFKQGRQFGRGISGGQRGRDPVVLINYRNRGGALPKVGGKKRNTVEKRRNEGVEIGGANVGAGAGAGAGKDAFGRDIEDRAEAMARVDMALSSPRGNGHGNGNGKLGGGMHAAAAPETEAESGRAEAGAEADLHAADPRTMEDPRDADEDAEETRNPTKRSRRTE